jgi:ABC-type dipeptide/oligopeptide/nickel transport system permease subunit
VATIGGWMLSMRSTVINVMAEDYVLLRAGQGLSSEARIVLHYVAPQRAAPEPGRLRHGAGLRALGLAAHRDRLLVPRAGLLLVRAVKSLDYPLIQGLFLTTTFAVLAANWMVDVAHVWLDPGRGADRARSLRKSEGAAGAGHPGRVRARRGRAGRGSWATPTDFVDVPLLPPSFEHWLGTTAQGQDVLAQTVAGARSTLVARGHRGPGHRAVGALVGTAAGYSAAGPTRRCRSS